MKSKAISFLAIFLLFVSLSGFAQTTVTFSADKSRGPDFVVQLTGLIPNTKFYIRAFATTSAGTTYGNELSFTTAAGKK